MVEQLNSNNVSLIVNKDLTHCVYREMEDIVVPMLDFYKNKFQQDAVMDNYRVESRASLLDICVERNALLRL